MPEKPQRLPMPADLVDALKEVDLQEVFAGLVVGKQNHIIAWIEQAARPETRAKRIAQTMEWTFRAHDRAQDRRKHT